MQRKTKDNISYMFEIEKRIFVNNEIFENEYSYLYGGNKDKIVTFQYYNIKTDKEGEQKRFWNYAEALKLARIRRKDGRYKDYEFLIIN